MRKGAAPASAARGGGLDHGGEGCRGAMRCDRRTVRRDEWSDTRTAQAQNRTEILRCSRDDKISRPLRKGDQNMRNGGELGCAARTGYPTSFVGRIIFSAMRTTKLRGAKRWASVIILFLKPEMT